VEKSGKDSIIGKKSERKGTKGMFGAGNGCEGSKTKKRGFFLTEETKYNVRNPCSEGTNTHVRRVNDV